MSVSLALAVIALTARVEARPRIRFFLDGLLGLSVPMGDAEYRRSFYPSPKLGFYLGAEVWLTKRFGVAPELALDGGPLVGKSSTGVSTGRFTVQGGSRFLIGFGGGHALIFRFLVGAELFVFGPGGRGGAGTFDAGPMFEPGIGMQFQFARHAIAGFLLDFPVGFHDYGTASTFTNADFTASGFVGFRL